MDVDDLEVMPWVEPEPDAKVLADIEPTLDYVSRLKVGLDRVAASEKVVQDPPALRGGGSGGGLDRVAASEKVVQVSPKDVPKFMELASVDEGIPELPELTGLIPCSVRVDTGVDPAGNLFHIAEALSAASDGKTYRASLRRSGDVVVRLLGNPVAE